MSISINAVPIFIKMLVFTKALEIHFHELRLAPVARDIQDY